MRQSDARPAGEMKFTFAPAGPSTGSDRSSLPRLTTSTSATSSTRTTRCGTPTAPTAACRPPGPTARPGERGAVGADASAPRAHRPDVLDRPVGGARVAAVDHDEVVPRPRHLVDRGPD